ncbi:hypothetical protein K438DRAFT_587524 [Mycena galopus ATCC 62051]|nr:hypothetical protein K438DRAFT_587524 [Mycena galopus ATCC 62051]
MGPSGPDWIGWGFRSGPLKSESPNATPTYRLTHLCDGCQEPERDGARFSVCKKCNEKTPRQVYYCSRPCQTSHWPIHKRICGKALTPDLEAVQNPIIYTEQSLAAWDRRDEGYRRSPALLRQIQYLDADASACDYMFFSPAGPHPILLPFFLERLVFRLTMQTAMSTGDPYASRPSAR